MHYTAPAPGIVEPRSLPLCVDLDGTLIASNTFYESLVCALKCWGTALRLFGWLIRGRAYLKARLAGIGPINPEVLPYNRPLLEYLRSEHERGRPIVLVTAADRVIGSTVAAHLGVFAQVIASEGVRNLKGSAKAAVLRKEFGEGGFTYAGDSRDALEVWRHAGGAILVGVSPRVADAAARITRIERRIENGSSILPAALKAVRPHQWSKNLLVFVPIVTADAMLDGSAWIRALMLFVGLSATASSIYLFNDLADLDADRRHPRKRNRPFASGSLPIPVGLVLSPILLILGMLLGIAVGGWQVIMLYVACSLAYSMVLKELPLIDVFALAALYSVRLFGGGQVTGYRVSMWLLAFSSFLFLSLAIVKRVGELHDMTRRAATDGSRRGYSPSDLPIMTAFGVAASFSSSIVLALYVQSHDTLPPHPHPEVMWAIVPVLLFWQCRLWLATARGYMNDDPIVYALRDWVSWVAVACVAIVFALSMM